jgi:hypothetical protein
MPELVFGVAPALASGSARHALTRRSASSVVKSGLSQNARLPLPPHLSPTAASLAALARPQPKPGARGEARLLADHGRAQPGTPGPSRPTTGLSPASISRELGSP